MSTPTRPKRTRTRESIVEVAERLWGERGIDAVSLREISAAVGLSNPASVQYHFGGRDELIRAIYAKRLPLIDARRRQLLDAARSHSRTPDLGSLLDCLFRPLLEQVDAGGRHSYASFLRQVLEYAPAAELRSQAMWLTPATAQLLALIESAMPGVPPPLVQRRLIAANLLMLDVVIGLDHAPNPQLAAEEIYADALAMLVGGIAADSPVARPASEA